MGEHRVCNAADVPEGEGYCAEVDGIEIALFNFGGAIHAIQNRCVHKNAPLCEAGRSKKNAEACDVDTRGRVNAGRKTVNCPWHWWEWDVETGANPVNDMRLRTFPVEVDEDDDVVVIL